MKTFLIILVGLLLIGGAIALYLATTTPHESAGVKLPLTESQQELLARVPASADAFALIPAAAALQAKLLANPVTRRPAEEWREKEKLPKPWMIGGADVVAWKRDKVTSYAVRLDPLRALLIRVWLTLSSERPARWDGSVFLINAGDEPGLSRDELTRLLSIGNGLPPGDALIVQNRSGRGVFPPIARPAVTSVQVTATDISLTSRAPVEDAVPLAAAAQRPAFPSGAMLSATFTNPPKLVDDLNRLFGTDVKGLLAGGGSISIYDIDAGTFLPKPNGVIVFPANDVTRAEVSRAETVINMVGETRESDGHILVSFDRRSVPLYIKDTFVEAEWPANRWSVRLDPKRLVPILERLGDSTGLRIAAGRLYRSARDLRKWIEALQEAQSIEAADSESNGVEELRVRVRSAEPSK